MQIAPFLLALLVLWIVNLCIALHYCRLGKMTVLQQGMPLKTDSLPPVTIVLSTHNQVDRLRQNLPLLLQQSYPGEYEVVVVDRHSDDETIALLEAMEESYPHLHHTYCPATARDISLQRLALTLGIKSACYEWVCILQPDCNISGNEWLTAMMQPCTDEVDAVQGFARYDEPKGWAGLRWQFFRLWQQMMWMPRAHRSTPYRADGACMCYRKSLFLQHQGFASSSNLEGGAETLLFNHNVRRGRCRVNLRSAALVTQPQPEDRQWSHERTFYMETRRHMRHTCLYRLGYFTAVWAHLLFALLSLALMIYHIPNYFAIGVIALMWVILIATRMLCYNYTARHVGAEGSYLSLPILQHLVPWWDTQAWLSWLFTRKKTFRKKFV